MSIRISSSFTLNGSGFIEAVNAVKNKSPHHIRIAMAAIEKAAREKITRDVSLSSSYAECQQEDEDISRLVREILKINGSNEQEMSAFIEESGYLTAHDYALSQLEQHLWDITPVVLNFEFKNSDLLLAGPSSQGSSEDIVGTQENPGPMAREIISYLSKRETELREKELSLRSQDAVENARQIENVSVQLEELKKAKNNFEKFLIVVRSNREMMLFDVDPARRQEQYHRFANQLFSVFNALKERSEEEYFFGQIPNLLQVCYTGWHENINQMRQLAGLEKRVDNSICQAILVVRNLRRELFLKHALPLALQNVGLDPSLSNDVHYQLACKQVLNDRYYLGYSPEELGDHAEHIVEVIQSDLLTVAKQIFDEKYTLTEVRKCLQDYYKDLLQEQRDLLFVPFLDFYKEEFSFSRVPVLDNFSKLEELYKELERCNQIDDLIHRQRELELLAREFQEHNLEVPFSMETPLDFLHQEIDKFNSQSSHLECYTACKLALNSSRNCQDAAQKIRGILTQEKIKHGLEEASLLADDKGKATAREEEWATSRQGVAREIQQIEQIIQRAIDKENPEQVKARTIEQKKLIQDRLSGLKDVKANLNAKLILKHTVTNNKELSNWGISLLGNLAGVFKPAAVDGEYDKSLQELLGLAKAWNPLRAEERDLLIVALERDGTMLRYASQVLKDEPEVVKLAVQQNGMALFYASEALKDDPEVVKLAVQQNGMALQCAGENLINDLEIVKLAVKQDWQALPYAGDIAQDDPEVVKIAARQDGLVLHYAGDTPKNDPEVVKIAVQQNGMALFYASDALRDDPEIAKLAVQQNGMALQYVGEGLRNDPEVVIVAVLQNGMSLQYASDMLKNDFEVARLAVQQDGYALSFVGDTFKRNREIVKLAVQQNKHAIEYADPTLRNDPEILALTKDK